MVTPELEEVRARIRSMRPTVQPDLATRRAEMDLTPTHVPAAGGVITERRTVAGRPARWYRPEGGDATRALLYLHGGAYVSGSLESCREICACLAVAVGAPVLALDYRLAPEHPFPAAIDDAVGAWRWLIGEGGIEPGRTTIAGDSAGGGLTLATCIRARDERLALPGAAVVVSPWTDLACRFASHHERAEIEPMLTTEFLRADAARYLGGADPLDPLASPVEADLAGLPPVLTLVGTDEILYDDAVVMHERLVAAGVVAELEVGDDMFHVWLREPALKEAESAMHRIAEFVLKHAGG